MDAAETAPVTKPQKRKMSKLERNIVIALIIAIPTGMITSTMAQGTSRSVLQKIFDEDNGLSDLRVSEVHMPILAAIPFYHVFSNIGILPRQIQGSFMITRKDGGKLSNGCAYGDFDFALTQHSNGSYVSVAGPDVFKLKMCSSGRF